MYLFEAVKVKSKIGLDRDVFTKQVILSKVAKLTALRDIEKDVDNNEKNRVQGFTGKGFQYIQNKRTADKSS